MEKGMRVILLGIFVFAVSISCNLIDTMAEKIGTGISLGQDYILTDDFSDPKSGWEIYSGEYGTAGYDQDGYLVESIVEGEYNWGAAGVNLGDIRLDVETTVLQTVKDGADAYGVDCRLQENGDGYGFRITSDGWATISKYVNLESSSLVDWFETDAIKIDGSANHLTVICNSNNLQFLVNGVSVAQVTDDTYTSGDIGFSVVGFDAGTVSVLFDNLTVQKP